MTEEKKQLSREEFFKVLQEGIKDMEHVKAKIVDKEDGLGERLKLKLNVGGKVPKKPPSF